MWCSFRKFYQIPYNFWFCISKWTSAQPNMGWDQTTFPFCGLEFESEGKLLNWEDGGGGRVNTPSRLWVWKCIYNPTVASRDQVWLSRADLGSVFSTWLHFSLLRSSVTPFGKWSCDLWHEPNFVSSGSLVMRDWQIDWNGTVMVVWSQLGSYF